MKNTRVHFIYNTANIPYGGANSFNRTLKKYFETHPKLGIQVVADPQHADVLFLNAASRGPRKVRVFSWRRLRYVDTLRDEQVDLAEIAALAQEKPLVHRLDGITALYGRADGREYDTLQIELNALAAYTVFQSEFCRESFAPHLSKKTPQAIAANGADGDVFTWTRRKKPAAAVNFIAASWSKNPSKGHADLILLAAQPNMVVTYVGRWPDRLPVGNVRVKQPLNQVQLASEMKHHHAFCHMAENDPAPNIVIEALATGLPVLYKNSGGTPEIADGDRYGQPLPDLSEEGIKSAINSLTARYDNLIEAIKRDRNVFLIDTAAQKYARVFKKAALKS